MESLLRRRALVLALILGLVCESPYALPVGEPFNKPSALHGVSRQSTISFDPLLWIEKTVDLNDTPTLAVLEKWCRDGVIMLRGLRTALHKAVQINDTAAVKELDARLHGLLTELAVGTPLNIIPARVTATGEKMKECYRALLKEKRETYRFIRQWKLEPILAELFTDSTRSFKPSDELTEWFSEGANIFKKLMVRLRKAARAEDLLLVHILALCTDKLARQTYKSLTALSKSKRIPSDSQAYTKLANTLWNTRRLLIELYMENLLEHICRTSHQQVPSWFHKRFNQKRVWLHSMQPKRKSRKSKSTVSAPNVSVGSRSSRKGNAVEKILAPVTPRKQRWITTDFAPKVSAKSKGAVRHDDETTALSEAPGFDMFIRSKMQLTSAKVAEQIKQGLAALGLIHLGPVEGRCSTSTQKSDKSTDPTGEMGRHTVLPRSGAQEIQEDGPLHYSADSSTSRVVQDIPESTSRHHDQSLGSTHGYAVAPSSSGHLPGSSSIGERAGASPLSQIDRSPESL
ncbi:hypothetical protein SeMB42_g05047 [Synchytrium endobioticum]|uniref:Uncharacterized protein n=1 Tax=Synchytrium endobioticum TaxID=286115 RepID=A0A507CU92_9FUNG|nr:hypothetical protein SeMB42_g05047 [Synchytrium endobioticum]